MEQVMVSVLMTSYNKEQFIQSAIESVLQSSYRNFELIIVDDRSADRTPEIAREFEKQDGRVKVYINENQKGDYPNRNFAASLAKGKYIKYVDADDLVYPWGLGIMVECMEKFPEAGWGLASLAQNRDKAYPFMLTPAEIYQYHHYTASLFHKAPLSAIIKKNVFDQVGGFSGKRQMSDTEMWHLLALRYPLVLMPDGVVWYRQHEQQESRQIRDDIRVRARYDVARLNFYTTNAEIPVSPKQREGIIREIKKGLNQSIIKNLIKGNFSAAKQVKQCMKDGSYDFKNI